MVLVKANGIINTIDIIGIINNIHFFVSLRGTRHTNG